MQRFMISVMLLAGALSTQAASLDQKINDLIHARMPNANIGVSVMDAGSGKSLYQYNGYQAFSPASNMKLFTAAASLYQLGPKYRYETIMAVNPSQFSGDTVNGNVYLYFSGDPTFKIKDLHNMFRELHQRGIDTIKGNIVLDDRRFDLPNYAPGSSYDDGVWYYSAPISAIMLNQNALYFQIRPNDTLGKPAKVYTSKNGRAFAHIASSTVKTVTFAHSMSRCQLIIQVDPNNRYNFSGCWPITGRPKGLKLAIRYPVDFTEQVIQKSLKTYGIKLKGNVQIGHMPNGLKPVSVYHSPQLKNMLTTMMKMSNNIYAESLLKTLGAEKYKIGSFQMGALALESVLHKKTGIDFNYARIRDGAGASRYDLITPMQITRLLYVMSQDKTLYPFYLYALPDAGANGTLRHRMTAFDMANNIAAKTGSMAGVSTLSGYLKTDNNHALIFSIMVNHIVGSLNKARNFQDQLLMILRRE